MAPTWTAPQPFEPLDHTADTGVRVHGASRAEALARLLLAHGQVLSGGVPAADAQQRRLALESTPLDLLAVDALRAAQELFDLERLIVQAVTVEHFDDQRAILQLGCGRYDPTRHVEGLELKAITYHAARFEAEGDGYVAQVLFDV